MIHDAVEVTACTRLGACSLDVINGAVLRGLHGAALQPFSEPSPLICQEAL